ncbi:MAG TPA: hypothetical protein VHN11_16530 [Xanthobacteraceae bacterium]|nr:hypothetical protein [Xanthobacteraceae bacterium]
MGGRDADSGRREATAHLHEAQGGEEVILFFGYAMNVIAGFAAGQLCHDGHWTVGIGLLASNLYTGTKAWHSHDEA